MFERKYKSWLGGTLDFLVTIKRKNQGAPPKKFEDCSERSKRRKTEKLRSETDTSMLLYATQMKCREERMIETSKI